MPPAEGSQSLDLDLLRRWPLPVDPHGDKFARGTVLVIAGSEVTPGAGILAARAALRMGAGRVQIATAAAVAPHVAVTVPEAKVTAVDGDHGRAGELREQIAQAECVLIGPGLSTEGLTALVGAVLEFASAAAVLVIDAAAMQAMATIPPEQAALRRGRIVLTPNRQELAGLLPEMPVCSLDHEEAVAMAAQRWGAVVTSFGTVRSPAGRGWHTTAGHPSLGTSGSGDVLCGLIAGVAARTQDADQAACWGTLAHALSGERLGIACGPLGFLAGELIDGVAEVLRPAAVGD